MNIAVQRIDMELYPRRSHFEFFCGMGYPYVGLTANVDVTEIVTEAKKRGQSVFLYLLYAIGRAANQVREFRQRIDGDGIIEYEKCLTSHTVMKSDGTYAYCEADPSLPFPEFLERTGKRQAEAAKHGVLKEESDHQSLLFISCVPWTVYTSIVQPVPFPADSNPRITWGKYFSQEGRILLPVSVLAHHGLVDGIQISRFYEEIIKISFT